MRVRVLFDLDDDAHTVTVGFLADIGNTLDPFFFDKVGDIFVSASRSETQGLTYIEAMASGLPLLCRKDDCLSGVLLPEVNGFAYTTEAEFLAGLSALSDAQTRRDMGAAAQSAAYARFSAESFTRKVLQVYQDCLPRSKEASAA